MDRFSSKKPDITQTDATEPLLSRLGAAPLAWLSQSKRTVSANEFLAHVHAVAKALPEAQHAINICENRYLFLVALCAVVVRSQTNLLPSNKNATTQDRLAERYADTYVIHDGLVDASVGLSTLDINAMDYDDTQEYRVSPQIPLSHLAVISFTSGSTGDAKPNLKTWRTLRDSTHINSQYMLPTQSETHYHLATVPGQHMWGLETSVLMSLFANVCLVDARPLYPQDIISLIKQMPQPATLISTPLHLRALAASETELPSLNNVLVATAPLSQELAVTIEQQFNTELREVYGCSEVGSMAVRRAAQTEVWQKFDGLTFSQTSQGEVSVSADHLPMSITLEDTLEMLSHDTFRLQGRVSDQVNIAGKRGSLLEVNNVLLKFSGLLDGVVFFPPQDRAVPRLVALVVLDKQCASSQDIKRVLRAHFRQYLDAAFVPRPILLVDALPREDNGKLLKTKLLDFYQTVKSQ